MNEIIFLVNETEAGKYFATSMGRAISIKANSWDELRSLSKRAVIEFFKTEICPQSIILHLTKEETLTLES